ncbi:MAG: PAS domain-containing protein, partial [Bacteroidales bacterium]|nr:PAS domain-containing protein [Bacteroidales bacterium]
MEAIKMVSKNILVQIIIRVTAVSATCLVLTWQLFEGSLIISAIIFGIIIAQISMLVNFLNSINRKLAFFFDAVQNEDSTLYFPEKIRNRSLRELNQSLNKVNSLIQKVTLENREQEQYFHTIIEQAATGILTFDEEGYIHMANSAAKRLLRYEYLTHIRQLERVDNKLLQLFREIKPSDQKLFHLTDEKVTMQLSLKATSIKLLDKKMTLVAIQDIKNELDDNELESWIKLIRVLTHEIMNSVAPITS